MTDDPKDPSSENRSSEDPSSGISGMLRNLETIVERLGEIAEKGGEVSRKVSVGDDNDLHGVFEFRMRTGIGGSERGPEAGAARGSREPAAGEPAAGERASEPEETVEVSDAREPVVDVYDEGDHARVVAEMPGVAIGDVRVDIQGDVLEIGSTGSRAYHTEVLLPRPAEADRASLRAANGIVELTVPFKEDDVGQPEASTSEADASGDSPGDPVDSEEGKRNEGEEEAGSDTRAGT
jgi:HSP20 family protein